MVMFAALQAFLPHESHERVAENTDESLLESLAASPTLAQFFEGAPPGSSICDSCNIKGKCRHSRHRGSNALGFAVRVFAASGTMQSSCWAE